MTTLSSRFDGNNLDGTEYNSFNVLNDETMPFYLNAVIRSAPLSTDSVPDEQEGLAVSLDFLDPMTGIKLEKSTFKQGDLVMIKINLDTNNNQLDCIVVEDLLPAGFEIENPRQKKEAQMSWLNPRSDWVIHQEMRDDRLLLFTTKVQGKKSFYYMARAVTPGTYTNPSITAEATYAPGIHSLINGINTTIEAIGA